MVSPLSASPDELPAYAHRQTRMEGEPLSSRADVARDQPRQRSLERVERVMEAGAQAQASRVTVTGDTDAVMTAIPAAFPQV
jgi:hypothetical protein